MHHVATNTLSTSLPTFGSLRPFHTSAVIFAFGGNVLTSSFQQTCRTIPAGGAWQWFVGKLFKKNVYLKSGDALERIAACDYVIFDKTGTLTKPEASLKDNHLDDSQIELAANLTRGSRHPYSRALTRMAGLGKIAFNIEEISGCGIQGIIAGKQQN